MAKGLTERPALQLEIRGVSSPLEDRRAMAEAAVLSKIRTGGIVPHGRQEEKRILEIYRGTFREDPEVLLTGSPAVQEGRDSLLVFRARERLIDSVQITENDLRGLAQRRAAAVREFVTGRAMIDPGRVFLIEVDTAAKAVEGRTRTTMTLTVH